MDHTINSDNDETAADWTDVLASVDNKECSDLGASDLAAILITRARLDTVYVT